MFQANQTAQIFTTMLKTTLTDGMTESAQHTTQIVIGVVMCIAAAMVMIGGIKRIGNVASKLVPSMCLIYCGGALIVILKNIDMVPAMFGEIFSSAFSQTAATGAFFGVAVKTAVVQGVRRACFSNEAGLGSAPIAHATAKTDEPIREGVVAAIGPFIDTIVICTMTALVVLITGTLTRGPIGSIESVSAPQLVKQEGGDVHVLNMQIVLTDAEHDTIGEKMFVHKPPKEDGGVPEHVKVVVKEVVAEDALVAASIEFPDTEAGREGLGTAQAQLTSGKDVFLFREGVSMTAHAFDQSLSGFGTYFIPIAALLFAFSTIISWGFYGETCTEYLLGEKAVLPFKFVYVSMIVVGASFMNLKPVLDFSDAMLGLMLVPNLIGTVLLAPRVIRASKDYFRRLKAGEFSPEALAAKRARRHKGEDI
jgi:AGCS family alanine or glycine:cation symporter